MSSVITAVQPSVAPQSGVKRALSGNPDWRARCAAGVSGVNVPPGGKVKTPKLSQGNKPNQQSNVPIRTTEFATWSTLRRSTAGCRLATSHSSTSTHRALCVRCHTRRTMTRSTRFTRPTERQRSAELSALTPKPIAARRVQRNGMDHRRQCLGVHPRPYV